MEDNIEIIERLFYKIGELQERIEKLEHKVSVLEINDPPFFDD